MLQKINWITIQAKRQNLIQMKIMVMNSKTMSRKDIPNPHNTLMKKVIHILPTIIMMATITPII